MIPIGEFRERLTIQQKDVTRNGIGDEVATWSDVATTWALSLIHIFCKFVEFYQRSVSD